MSDNKYSRATIIAAVENASLKRICESCSRMDGWLVPSRPEDTETVEVMAAVRADDPSLGFDFVPMICQHCGSTRFLHLETLLSNLSVGRGNNGPRE